MNIRACLPLPPSSGRVLSYFLWNDFFNFQVFIETAKAYVSVCLTVKNIDRRIYLLKRQNRFDVKRNLQLDPETEVSVGDVYAEFDQKVANRLAI